jgi:tetratricopeptide (TPR) repeat protein
MTSRSSASLHNAISFFEQSLEADPKFALGYVALGDANVLLNLYDITPPENAYVRAEEAARRALAIDDNLSAAHATLGYIYFFKKRERSNAELEYRRAIQINPSYAQARHWFALMLSATGRSDEAVSEAQTSENLDPRSPIVKTSYGQTYFYAGQYEKALAKADESLAINEGFVPAYKTKRWIYQVTGNYEAALATFRKEYSYSGGSGDEPGWMIIKAQVEALGANRESALGELNRIVEMPEIKNNPFAFAQEIAFAYNAFGETGKALDWLQKAEAANNHGFNFLGVDPRLRNLQNEQRFQALLQKLQGKN